MKRIPLNFLILLAGLLLGFYLVRSNSWFQTFIGIKPPIERIVEETIVERIKEIARIETSETYVSDIFIYKEEGGLWNSLPWGDKMPNKGIIVHSTGLVTAGYDLQKDPISASVDHSKKKISISLPPARILGFSGDPKQAIYLQFGDVQPDKVADCMAQARTKLQKAAYDFGGRRVAEKNLRSILSGLGQSFGYTVEFVNPSSFVPQSSKQGL